MADVIGCLKFKWVAEELIWIFRCKNNISKANKENITSYFYKNKKNYKIINFKNKKNYSQYNLAIDTTNNLKKIKLAIEKKNFLNFSWEKILKVVYKNEN